MAKVLILQSDDRYINWKMINYLEFQLYNTYKEEYTINEVETIGNTVIIPLSSEGSMLIEAMDLASQSI